MGKLGHLLNISFCMHLMGLAANPVGQIAQIAGAHAGRTVGHRLLMADPESSIHQGPEQGLNSGLGSLNRS